MTSSEQETAAAQVSLTVDWTDASDKPTLHVNQFALQPGPPTAEGVPDGLYLLLGNIAPPLVFSKDAESLKREIESLGGIRVMVHGRFHMSRARLGELIDALNLMAKNYDTAGEMAEMALTRDAGEES